MILLPLSLLSIMTFTMEFPGGLKNRIEYEIPVPSLLSVLNRKSTDRLVNLYRVRSLDLGGVFMMSNVVV